MEGSPVLIIGAGAAGLAAADVISRAGLPVIILEARDRIGGRIHTITSRTGELPIELGAEFIHGEENAVWEVIAGARLKTHAVPDRHWRATRGTLVKETKFWEKLDEVMGRMNPATPDQDFQSFLDQAWGMNPAAKKLAREYVEGFHAAPASRISVHALAKAEAAAEKDKGTSQFRIHNGYAETMRWLEREVISRQAKLMLSSIVRRIRWEPGQVEVMAQTSKGLQVLAGCQAVITVPLGVLQQVGESGIQFEPELKPKQRALEELAMGAVVRITLQFNSRFWPVKNFGFIHCDEGPYPTWWSDPRGPLLTGWAGGPQAEDLLGEPPEALQAEAVRMLSAIFKIEVKRIQELIVASYTYDWTKDPFSRGVYSYTPVRLTEMPARLAEPVAGTLFFAGEATDCEGEQGTVHGALASGRRAAQELLQNVRVPSKKGEALRSLS